MRRQLILSAAVAAGVLFSATSSWATDREWVGSSGASFILGTNWSPAPAGTFVDGGDKLTISGGSAVLYSYDWTVTGSGGITLQPGGKSTPSVLNLQQNLNLQDQGAINILGGSTLYVNQSGAVATLEGTSKLVMNNGFLNAGDIHVQSPFGVGVSSGPRIEASNHSIISARNLYIQSVSGSTFSGGTQVNLTGSLTVGHNNDEVAETRSGITLDASSLNTSSIDVQAGNIRVNNQSYLYSTGAWSNSYAENTISGNSTVTAGVYSNRNGMGGSLTISDGSNVTFAGIDSENSTPNNYYVKGASTLYIENNFDIDDTDGVYVENSTLSLRNLSSLRFVSSGYATPVEMTNSTLEIRGNETMSIAAIERFMSSINSWNGTIRADSLKLRILGRATLQDKFTIDGGDLTVGSITNFKNLTFNAGTLTFLQDQTITTGGDLGATIIARENQNWNFNSAYNVIAADGSIRLRGGNVSYGCLTNNGLIKFENDLSTLGNPFGWLSNNGIIQGSGAIAGSVTNNAGGTIVINTGEYQRYTGNSETYLRNSGRIHVNGGMLFAGNVSNGDTGNLALSGGSVYVSTLYNSGNIDASRGDNHIFGNVINQTYEDGYGKSVKGKITVAGGQLNIHGNLTNDGTVTVGAGGVLAVFGDVDGNGTYVNNGGSLVFSGGQINPGHSPGVTNFVGDATFDNETIVLEIAGTDPSQYDRFNITSGSLTLIDSTLKIVLLNSFVPQAGDTFNVFTGNLDGQFTDIIFEPLPSGLLYDTSRLYSEGVLAIATVPEPASLAMLALAAPLLLRRKK